MQTYKCPSCGSEVKFQSSVSVTCVCPACRSLIVRKDKDVEAIGKIAELPDDISPFQIGTQGIYKGTHFGLIGRMKIGWEDGCWNEWFMYTDSGKKGWLEEAQGFLAISFEETLPDSIRKELQSPKLGHFVTLGGKPFSVADIKETECISSEGELPLVATKGIKSTAIDLISRDGGFASVEYDKEKGDARLYIGEYLEFNQLHFSHLRELPGWKMPLNPQPTAVGNKPHG